MDEVGLSASHCVILFHCIQDYCKSNQPISSTLGVMVGPAIARTDSRSLFTSLSAFYCTLKIHSIVSYRIVNSYRIPLQNRGF